MLVLVQPFPNGVSKQFKKTSKKLHKKKYFFLI